MDNENAVEQSSPDSLGANLTSASCATYGQSACPAAFKDGAKLNGLSCAHPSWLSVLLVARNLSGVRSPIQPHRQSDVRSTRPLAWRARLLQRLRDRQAGSHRELLLVPAKHPFQLRQPALDGRMRIGDLGGSRAMDLHVAACASAAICDPQSASRYLLSATCSAGGPPTG